MEVSHINIEESFPRPIKLRKWSLFQSNVQLIQEVEQALLKSYICKNDAYIEVYADKSEISKVLELTSIRNEKSDRRYQELHKSVEEATVN